ncbi:exosome-associated factor Rrp47/DNA strand repair C1D [Neocallimastix lanati (nom. inval.)]|jgi:exosome complex protein LRP1|uniref:Exosome complex protein n=1 Tax=Neocallimastix californiae TaxID=1754190 RepID=A0A1Y2CYQ2_9FUNG|nr:exosome-associated factor Rrp47/DNA strand repair C1D [Neocallimastix sp. JGI-2020a]ORY52148.1 exosome-associated factor Rrp47/DNA strand repair C1D [Neocallimastix californiae]|eukprot:ORY52148.1 exosome-associated factor Rrp47/DNA strand repair C1D [Neocallimastix californiae]
MDILDNLKLYVDNLDANIDNVQTVLDVIFSKSYQEQLSKLDNMKKAKFNIMMAYVIDTLLFVYLKTNGVATKDHPIMKELERVKKYFIKLQKLEKNTENKAKFKIDKDAAGRMINNALNNNERLKNEEIEQRVERLLKSVQDNIEKKKDLKEEEKEIEEEKDNKDTETAKTKRKSNSDSNTNKKIKKAKH